MTKEKKIKCMECGSENTIKKSKSKRNKAMKLFKPNEVLLNKIFFHQQPYKFCLHKAKTEIFVNEYNETTIKNNTLTTKNKNVIIGHIDFVQLKFGSIYVLDYKPEADKVNAISQLFVSEEFQNVNQKLKQKAPHLRIIGLGFENWKKGLEMV